MSDQHVDGVSYFRVDGFQAEVFRCLTWRSTLSVPFCASRWREAQKSRGERAEALRLCASCPIGATHAGERPLPRAENFGNNVCVRCRRGTLRRIVVGRLCIGCYNREREWLIGKNAKGTVPIKAQEELSYRTLGVVLDPGQPTEEKVEFTEIALDEQELRLSIGRMYEGHIEFQGLVQYGTYRQWRPDGLGGMKAIVKPPSDAAHAVKPAADKSGPGARRSAAASRLTVAALSSASCLSGVRLAPPLSPAGRSLLAFGGARLPLAA